MRAIVFVNGEINDLDGAKALIKSDDLLLAADGGARHCMCLGLRPDVLIGDMDSLSEEEIETLQAAGTEIIRHNPRKDETDLELALLYLLEQEVDEALILGGLGRRWDQTLANLLLPAYHQLKGLQVSFWADGEWLYLLDREREIFGKPGATVSLIPLQGDAEAVTTEGLEWPLNNEKLYFGATRGVSNLMLSDSAWVRLKEGLLLVVVGAGD